MATPLNTKTEAKPHRQASTTGQTIQESAANSGKRVHPSQQPKFDNTDQSLTPAYPTKGPWSYDPSMRVVFTVNRDGEKQLIAAMFSGTPETHANGRLVSQTKILRSALVAISRGKKAILRQLAAVPFPEETDGIKLVDLPVADLAKMLALYLVTLTKEIDNDPPGVK